MIGVQSIGAIAEHAGREISHNRGGLDMEVAEHFVRGPVTNEADGIMVNFRA